MASTRFQAVILLVLLSASQTPATLPAAEPESTFTETIEVNVVDLNVVVTTITGKPVNDLGRDDFEIREDGEVREISHFSRVVDGVAQATTVPASPIQAVQRMAARDRSIILTFDSSIDRPYLRRALTAARDFVLDRSDDDIHWSVVLLGNEPYSLLPLTDENWRVAETLDSMLASLSGGPLLDVPMSVVPRSPHLDGPWCRLYLTEQSLTYPWAARSLSEIFRAHASVPGSKALVVYHQGRGGSFVKSAHRLQEMSYHIDLWRNLGRQASSAGFKVYAMNVLGLNSPVGGTASRNFSAASLQRVPSNSVADFGPTALARTTGGDFFALNGLDEAIEAAVRETGTYYSMAFVAPHDHDGEAHELEVKVRSRPLLWVRHSSGFFDVDPRTLLVEQLAAPAYFPKEGGALPLVLEVATRASTGDEVDLSATVATPTETLTLRPENGSRIADVDIFVALHDDTGALVSLKQDRYRLKVPEATPDRVLSVPLRIRLPATSHSVTVALYDPVSGLSGIDSTRVGGR